MKAGSLSSIASKLDCLMANIPLKVGFAPLRWKKCIDAMTLKKSGITQLGSLRTIILFPVDCNYVFKHIGRQMMALVEQTRSLTPEQYGSRKHHKAIDLVVNKALTHDIL
jgi:hypothetical protein